MVEVYDIKVRYMRRIQVREYEPAEAEVTISAQIGEDEDHNDVTTKLMGDAREAVKSGLTGKAPDTNKSKSIQSQVKETKKKNKDTPKKVKTEIPDDIIPDGIEPDKGSKPEKPVKKVSTKKKSPPKQVVRDTESEDIPDEPSIMSIKDLQEFVGTAVTSRKIKPAQIKEIISVYNAVRLSDVPEANRSGVKVAIENAMLLE